MNTESYIVISTGPGDTYVHSYTKEELLAALEAEDGDASDFFASFPENADTGYWGKKLVIRGTVVQPKTIPVTVRWDI